MPIIKKSWLILFIGLVVFFNSQLALAATTSLTVTITVLTPPETCGNSICTGNETCSNCPADCGACSAAQSPAGGGGGGGGSYVPIVTQVIFKGLAYPQSDVTLLKDAQVAATTKAGADAKFEISLSGISGGVYIFGIWAEDKKGLRSITHTFSIAITSGATTMVSGIFLPPSISLDKDEVKRGDFLSVFGYSVPQAEIAVFINSGEELVKKTSAQSDGAWFYKIDTIELDYGDHTTRSRASKNGDISTFSQALAFKVSSKNVSSEGQACPGKADLNNDCRVNLIDFSIAAYWYKRPLTGQARTNVDAKLKVDGVINLTDFSILAYYWTG